MSPRRDVPEHHRSLKALFRALLGRCGGLEAAAACVRVGRSQLANYTDMHSDQFAPIDVVADLEAVAGEPLVTSEMARRGGYALIHIGPQVEGELSVRMADFGKEVGESFAAYAAALADGQMSRPEIEKLAREMGEVARAAHRAGALLASMLEEGR